MASSTHRINTEIYQRTTRIFQNKRNALPPDRLKLLATEVVDRLVALNHSHDVVLAEDISEFELDAFCDALLHASSEEGKREFLRTFFD